MSRAQASVSEDTKHSLPPKQRLEYVASYVARRGRLWYRFKISFLFTLVSMMIAISIWFFFNFIFGEGGAKAIAEQDFGSNYFTYVLIGVIINQYIVITITLYMGTLQDSYWQNQLEMYITSPGRMGTFFLSSIVWTYLYSSINVLIYFAVGIFVFGATIALSPAGILILIVILFILIVALSGIGLISASMFFLINAKGDVEPISWFVVTLTGLVSGVFYPPEIFITHFPPLYALSKLFPQTYAIQGIRRVLINGADFASPEILSIILTLAIFAVILFPLGIYAFKAGIRKAEREGKLTRWT
ncbi:MAG: ABC transporter permease [Thermoplasmata archaeon]|nr:ABC transporter permease [Thermoplasmata archaeon]